MSFKKRFLAGSLAAVMTLGMVTGCSTVKKSDLSDDYSEVTAATYGGEKIYLDEVNFYLRNSQMMYEYYGSMYGMNIWDNDTMEDSLREEVMSAIYQTKVLCDYAEEKKIELTEEEKKLVKETVEKLLTDESNKTFLEIAGSDKELLTELMTQNALANKAYHAIVSEAKITTTEEKVQKNGVTYLLFKEKPEETETKADDSKAETEEETKEETKYYTEKDANAALEKIQSGKSITDVAKSLDMETAKENFGVKDEQTTEFGKAAVKLKKGESAVAYQENTGWYVMVCDTENDEDATKNAYDTAVKSEKDAYFKTAYAGLEKPSFKVNEEVIESLNIKDTPVLGTEKESEESTEAKSGETEASKENKGSKETEESK
ncbi:MAG: SurA N-terminal domain-containing protein [Lachnospiraceae bacterium]|nr:SurA N-terminal domain-containing protein [Lachnospiraceae bacterium]